MEFGTVNKRKLRNRLLFLEASFTAFFLFVLHLFNLQIVENLVWEGKARAVAQRSEPLPSQRGLIWDRNYDVPLAVNSDSYSIQIVPAETTPLTPESLSKSWLKHWMWIGKTSFTAYRPNGKMYGSLLRCWTACPIRTSCVLLNRPRNFPV